MGWVRARFADMGSAVQTANVLKFRDGSRKQNGLKGSDLSSFGTAGFGTVTAAYFQTLGMPLARGRGFGAADREGSPPVAVINRTLERRLFGGILDANAM